MTPAQAISRLLHIASADISTRKPVPYLMQIAEACNQIGLKINAWGMTKAEAVAALEQIGAEKMRDTAMALITRPTAPRLPVADPDPPARPKRLQAVAQRATGIITAAEANEYLRSLTPVDAGQPH